MTIRPGRDSPWWAWVLTAWDGLAWAVVAILALHTALADVPGWGRRFGSLALLAALAAAYAVLRGGPAGRVVTPHRYLGGLVVALGLLAWLRDGYGVLYTLFLPQFTVLAKGTRPALALGGAGAAAIVVGASFRRGWGPEYLGPETLSASVVYGVGVLLTLLTARASAAWEERARLRAELTAAQAGLAEAQRRQGAAEERARLAREIHDTIAQGLASIVVLAEAARAGRDPAADGTARHLLSIERTARENLAEARALVEGGPPGGTAPGSAADSVRRAVERFAEDTGVTVTADLADVACDQPTRVALLRCAQETLANVRKHAGATAVSVVLARTPGAVELEITDDGRGFAVGQARGFGLDGMRRRLAELGGELSVTSAPGVGTRVLALLPLNGQVS